jgi:DNA mismatch repair protein MutL
MSGRPVHSGESYRRVAVLPDHLANKIAAGEVIQRPESAVKELLENALDAGATRITVQVREGGKTFIQVADDGAGMDEQDAVTAFLRHATSKILTYEDLEAIRTFGFRGEALASIAAVSQVTMITRRREEEIAVVVKMDAGKSPAVSRAAREPGTTVTVQNLFFNVPARRKFLKSTSTEFRHIHDAVQRAALSRPDVAIEFVSDDEKVFRLSAGSLEHRIIDLFGEPQMESLIPLREETQTISLSGYVGKPSFGAKSRAQQFLFLNGRFIIHRGISHAVQSAYEHLIEPGTFPFFVVFLDLDPHHADVNIHPSKMEAKFDDEQGVYRLVASAVRKCLGSSDFVPSISFGGKGNDASDVALRFGKRQHFWPGDSGSDEVWRFPDHPLTPGATDRPEAGGVQPQGERYASLFGPPISVSSASATDIPSGVMPSSSVWQLHNRYILSPIEGGLLIVDQHVAHERVIYERAMKRFGRPEQASQQLLFPHTFAMTAGDYSLLEDLLPHLEGIGFEIKLFGKNTAVIEGVPPEVRSAEERTILEEVLGLYRDYSRTAPLEVKENVAKSFSCRSAIKSGDPLTDPEMRSLLEQLFAAQMPYVCPHGRPIALRVPLEEFDRRFGRTS